MGDGQALCKCGLFDLVENIPFGFCVIADAAYPATKCLLPMFYGANKTNPVYDKYNYMASKCHIRIKMAFGKMKTKWRILQRPLVGYEGSLKFAMHSIARLHNFCIDKHLLKMQAEGKDDIECMVQYQRHTEEIPIDQNDLVETGTSELREVLANRIQTLGLVRMIDTNLN